MSNSEFTISVSVMIPTRRRPDSLRRAVSSCLSLADQPAKLEFLFATDDDDAAAVDICHDIIHSFGGDWGAEHVFELKGPRRGYSRVFELYNLMAQLAKGKHVLSWNDDTEMLTKGWDTLLCDKPDEPAVQFLRRDCYGEADTTFPVTDKRIVDALGGVSRHMYADTWIGQVAQLAGVLRWRNDIVFAHHWPQQDATMKEGVEDIRNSGQHETFRAMSAEKADDARKIREMLAKLKGGAT